MWSQTRAVSAKLHKQAPDITLSCVLLSSCALLLLSLVVARDSGWDLFKMRERDAKTFNRIRCALPALACRSTRR